MPVIAVYNNLYAMEFIYYTIKRVGVFSTVWALIVIKKAAL